MLKKIKTKILMMSLVALVPLIPTEGRAATVTVDCSTKTLQSAINTATPGTTISMSGTCNENVNIGQTKNLITVDGGGTAKINGVNAAKDTINIKGRGIVIKRLNITGGNNGIHIIDGGTATIDANTIHHTARNGISIGQISHADIISNTIQYNANHGIALNDNASAHIGFAAFSDTVAKPNIIRLNEGNGIAVHRSSSADIVGNKINSNTHDGVVVRGASHADISMNTINANKGNGITVFENSGVNLGNYQGTTIFDLPNATTTNNSLYGAVCEFGAYIAGRLGTLNGVSGATGNDSSCLADVQ